MAKKPGFTAADHMTVGAMLGGMYEEAEGLVRDVIAAYPAGSPQARSATGLARALHTVRRDLENAAHAERVPGSMALYGLEAPAASEAALRREEVARARVQA